MSLTKSTDSIRGQDIERKWYIADLNGVVLGRAAVKIANLLRGKGKPSFTPHTDTGDVVVVINCAKVQLTGRKREQKMYRHHTQYPGGLKETKAATMLVEKSDEAVRRAVRGMVPKGPLGRQMMKKLKVYRGVDHPHAAQNPVTIEL